jgi:hypothetical protein
MITGVLILGTFTVWAVLLVAEEWIVAPRWAWRASAGLLGVGWICLYAPSHWWHGLGVGGAAVALALVTDLVLVLADWVRTQVLKGVRKL